MYIYPDNLKAKARLWLWELRDVAIIGGALLIAVFALTQIGSFVPLVCALSMPFSVSVWRIPVFWTSCAMPLAF